MPQAPKAQRLQQLQQAYQQAIYRLNTTPEIEFKIDQTTPQLAALLQQHHCEQASFITAYNPFSQCLSAAENQARQLAMCQALAQQKFTLIDGYGCDPAGKWPAEQSVLVLAMPIEIASQYARRYQQHAFVHICHGKPELIWSN